MNTISFKTSVKDKYELISIRPILDIIFGENNWSFRTEGIDRILSVVSSVPCAPMVNYILKDKGFHCEELTPALSF
ncbi:hypothetical protein WAE58_02260 [Pedobacter panaciterrae]|jgi:hypothetical protein|uniref:Uncharacterized protein n=1 Tax=Pedobacter panaciterrae TaxID=363849 RepID=A0ABU8NG52_9SPHI|nr:hypothetical protein [Pedobacter panaciterrae]NQX57050.1 hypothetical protein [Pedobacter panaciterrae]